MSAATKRSKSKRLRLIKLQDRAQLLLSFGQRLQQLRLKGGLTPSQFEAKSGIDAGNLAKYEQGHREPGLIVIVVMARCLGISLGDLLDFDDSTKQITSRPGGSAAYNMVGDPIVLLRSLMNERNMKSKELAELLDVSPGLVSDIMNYKKGLSKRNIRLLANHFNIDIALLYGSDT